MIPRNTVYDEVKKGNKNEKIQKGTTFLPFKWLIQERRERESLSMLHVFGKSIKCEKTQQVTLSTNGVSEKFDSSFYATLGIGGGAVTLHTL